jgi:hypothetical protein
MWDSKGSAQQHSLIYRRLSEFGFRMADGRDMSGYRVIPRADRTPGSFKINLRSGRWSDFATGAKGGDVISLAAHLFGLSQVAAARKLAAMLGISTEDGQ